MVIGIPKVETLESSCIVCLVGEQHVIAFNSILPMRAKEGLDVIHSYVYGPLEVLIYGWNKYFITFVNEFSRILWLFLIKAKSEAMQIFKDFKAIMEIKSGKLIKILRTDGGGEYTSKDFDSLCTN